MSERERPKSAPPPSIRQAAAELRSKSKPPPPDKTLREKVKALCDFMTGEVFVFGVPVNNGFTDLSGGIPSAIGMKLAPMMRELREELEKTPDQAADIYDDESRLLDILARRGAPWIADVIQCAETDMDPAPRLALIERIQRGGKQGKP